MERILIYIGSAMFLAFGVSIAAAPVEMFQWMSLPMPDELAHRIELRAFYGGLELGLGAVLLVWSRKPEHVRSALWLIAFAYGGTGITRLFAIALEGGAPTGLIVALLVEIAMAAAAVVLLLRAPK